MSQFRDAKDSLRQLIDQKDITGVAQYLVSAVRQNGNYAVAATLYDMGCRNKDAKNADAPYIKAIEEAFKQMRKTEGEYLPDNLYYSLGDYRNLKEDRQPKPLNPGWKGQAWAAFWNGIVFGPLLFTMGCFRAVMERGVLYTDTLAKNMSEPLKTIVKGGGRLLSAIVGFAVWLASWVASPIGWYLGVKEGIEKGVSSHRRGSSFEGTLGDDTFDWPAAMTTRIGNKVLEYGLCESMNDRIKFLVDLQEDADKFKVVAAIRFDMRNDPERLREFNNVVRVCFSPEALEKINEEFAKLAGKSEVELKEIRSLAPNAEEKNEAVEKERIADENRVTSTRAVLTSLQPEFDEYTKRVNEGANVNQMAEFLTEISKREGGEEKLKGIYSTLNSDGRENFMRAVQASSISTDIKQALLSLHSQKEDKEQEVVSEPVTQPVADAKQEEDNQEEEEKEEEDDEEDEDEDEDGPQVSA